MKISTLLSAEIKIDDYRNAMFLEKAQELLEVLKKNGINQPLPDIRWVNRGMGATAGLAYMGRNLIFMNSQYLAEHESDLLNRTLGHEIAHISAYIKYQYSGGHGPPWKRVMEILDIIPSPCHQYSGAGIEGRWPGHCDCKGEHNLSVKTASMIKTGRSFTCQRCGSLIKLGRKEIYANDTIDFDVEL